MKNQIEKYYEISYIQVSLIFLSPVLGFIISTLANHTFHVRLGQRGVIAIAGTCQLLAYIIACLHPPFPALVVVYALVGLGCGAKQAAWNSFISGLRNSNELLGLLHGCYGIGATVSPLLASILISKKGWRWYQFYYILIGMAALDMLFSFPMFATQSGKVYKEQTWVQLQDMPSHGPGGTTHPHAEESTQEPIRRHASRTFHALKGSRTLDCLKSKEVLLCSGFLLAYVGSEVALGGWLVTFMMKVRGGSAVASGITSSGLWAGITLGRIVLGFVTGRFFKSEKWAVSAYLIMAMIIELLFWLIPSFLASAINVAFLGEFYQSSQLDRNIVTYSNHHDQDSSWVLYSQQ